MPLVPPSFEVVRVHGAFGPADRQEDGQVYLGIAFMRTGGERIKLCIDPKDARFLLEALRDALAAHDRSEHGVTTDPGGRAERSLHWVDPFPDAAATVEAIRRSESQKSSASPAALQALDPGLQVPGEAPGG